MKVDVEREETQASPVYSQQQPPTTRMERPQIHTTKYGTQYVNVADVIQSEAGWAEIQRIKDANLVQPSENGTNGSPPQHNEK
jgi:hypothetical protein